MLSRPIIFENNLNTQDLYAIKWELALAKGVGSGSAQGRDVHVVEFLM